jgi:hypothetical protein
MWSVVGLSAWIGATVWAAATVDDPSDAAGRVLGTFAIGGAAFFALTFAGAAVGIRRQRGTFDDDLYRRLIVVETPERVVRAAVAGHRRLGYVYVGFGAVTTGLALAAIGLGTCRWSSPLLYGALALVIVWSVVASMSGSSGSVVVSPLGLRVTSTPGIARLPSGRGRFVGSMTMVGERHGRSVAIEQRPTSATTTIRGARPVGVVTLAAELAARTGLDADRWHRVRAESGPDGVVVRRRGNGAGRWLLEDLLLAESLAAD